MEKSTWKQIKASKDNLDIALSHLRDGKLRLNPKDQNVHSFDAIIHDAEQLRTKLIDRLG